MKATKDNAVYIEKAILQDDGDTDFEKITDTTVNFIPNEVEMSDETTNTSLVSEYTELTENEEVLLIDTNNNITDTALGSVTTEAIDTTQTLDMFGDNSCIAAYPFDGNANDLSGNYNGTWSGTESYDTGKYGQAAKFDGSSYIKMGDWLTTVSSSGILSFAYWINTTSTDDETLWSTDNLTQQNTVLISIDYLQYWDINATEYKYDLSISDGVYHFIVAIIDTNNSVMRYYLDGEKVYETTFASGSSILNSSDMSLGKRSGSAYYVNGNVDEVRIFNKALTDDEIQQLYNEQRTKYIADISSANLSEAPVKAFKKQLPDISIACEATAEDITDTSFTELTPETTTYDGSKFTTVYSDLGKEGRAIQRKIIAPNAGIEIIEPFTSNLWKKDS